MLDVSAHLPRAHRRLRLGMVGGGRGAFIGEVHAMGARISDRYQLIFATWDGGRVLQQEKLIGDPIGGALVNEPFLERVRRWVLDPAEPAGMERQRRAERPELWFGERRLHARTIAGVPCSAVR